MSIVSDQLKPAVHRQRRDFPRPLLQGVEGPRYLPKIKPRDIDKDCSLGEMGRDAQYAKDPPQQSAPSGFCEHRVGPTETITTLAVKYGMSPHEIRSVNRLHLAAVFPGQLVLVRDPAHERTMTSGDNGMAGYPATSPGGRHIRATRSRASEGKSVAKGQSAKDSSSPSSPDVESAASDSHSPLLVIPHDMSKPPLMATTSTKEFLNDSCFRVKVLYITRRQGLVPGTLESTPEYIRFVPHPDSKFVREHGAEALSLFLEYEDLLTPMSQRKPPSLKKKQARLEPGFAGHKVGTDDHDHGTAAATTGGRGAGKKDGEAMPVFLALRAQLVFGMQPTPETIAYYWFAVMYVLKHWYLWNLCRTNVLVQPPWERCLRSRRCAMCSSVLSSRGCHGTPPAPVRKVCALPVFTGCISKSWAAGFKGLEGFNGN
eukprot:m.451649 g.451649  ORF g.451649 m.451649 type:complete len:429 (-) comp21531_c0_seq1:1094-2380(-)